MSKDKLRKIIIVDTIAVIVIIVGIFVYMGQKDNASDTAQTSAAASSQVQNYDGADIGGSYTLINQDGETVSNNTYAGSYKLMFFGFTFCPHICPTELQKMAATLKILDKDGEKILPVFITTDPERDTPDVMKEYVEQFHPRLIGLTGSMEQVKHIQDEFRVYAAKAQDPEMSEYTMNHSSYMYLMGPNDKLLGLYSDSETPSAIAENIKAVLKANGS